MGVDRRRTEMRRRPELSTEVRGWWDDALRHRGLVVVTNALALAEVLAALVLPWVLGALVGVYLGAGVTDLGVGVLVLVAATVLCAQAALGLATHYLRSALGEDVISDLRAALHRRVLEAALGTQGARARGDVLAVLFHDAAVLGRAQVGCWVGTIPMAVLGFGAAVLLIASQPALAAVTLVVGPLLYVLLRIVSRRVRPLADLTNQVHGEGSALAQAHLGVVRTAKAYGAEAQLTDQFANHLARARLAGKRFALACAAIGPLGRIAGLLTLVAGLWVSSHWLGSEGMALTMTPAQLVTFVLYGLILLRPLSAGLTLYGEAQQGIAAAHRIDALLEAPNEPSGRYAADPVQARAELSIERLGFAYPGRRALFRDFSLELSAGEIVGICGPNGIGKTTLLNLILGFERAQRGRIVLDGISIDQWDLAAYRRWFGWVGQPVEFLPTSLACNVAAGESRPDRERVRWALDAALATEIIEGLAGGLDAPLGPLGEPLSAGQAQRVALARAIYRRAPILLLDDPSSILDADAEAQLLTSVRERIDGCTMLMVGHRRESLTRADRIVEIDLGGHRTHVPPRRDGKVIVGPWRGAK